MVCPQSLLGIEAFDVPYGMHTFVSISIHICCEICFELPPSDSERAHDTCNWCMGAEDFGC